MSASLTRLAGVAWRESRTARRRLLLYMSSITLGVAALVAIDSFADNVTASVHAQARTLLGGDIAISSRDTFSEPVDRLLDTLARAGIGIARQTSFASMAGGTSTANPNMRLSQVRAVGPRFPFYGAIETAPATAWDSLQAGPYAVVDSSLLVSLQLSLGDTLVLGSGRFIMIGTIASVPGEVAVTAAIGPRIYIARRYLAATGLLVFGSRADDEALVKLPPTMTPGQFQGRYGPSLFHAHVRTRTVAQTEYRLSDAIDQLRNFLAIVGLVALLLGGIGVASGVHAFVMRKIDTVAILRCLGATSGQVLAIYVTQAAVMGLVGAAIGVLFGIALQFAMPHMLAGYLPVGVTVHLAPRAILTGLGVGAWVALVFALRPLLGLRNISPLQALRRETDATVMGKVRRSSASVVVSLAIVATVFGLTLARAERFRDAVWFSAGILAAVGVLWIMAVVVAGAARHLPRPSWPFVLRQGMANLYRPGNQTRSVILALGFGVFLLSTLYQAQASLLHQLRLRLSELKANVAFIDVQGHQAPVVDSIIRVARDTVVQRIPIVPLHVAAINGRTAAQLVGDTLAPRLAQLRAAERRRSFAGRRLHWALRRGYDATYRDSLESWEKVVAGAWFPSDHDTMPQVSLDSALARRVGIAVGDTVTWNIQGVEIATRVTSLRDVEWSRLQPDFPVVFQPRTLAKAPQQIVFLANAPSERRVALLQRAVVTRYPNVSSIDVSLVQQTVSGLLARVTSAIQFFAVLSLVLGVPVLFTAVAATRRERLREGVLLKTLGATKHQIGRIMFAEYALLGLLGSVAGVLLSEGSAWGLLHYLLGAPFTPAVIPALGVSAGMTLVAVAIGMVNSREVFASTPMAALREA